MRSIRTPRIQHTGRCACVKLKHILLGFVALAACGVVAWFICRPTPEIRFAGFQEGTNGRMALFQIVNESSSPFVTFGYGAESPFYSYRVSTPAGWKKHQLGWCGTGAGPHTLAPHSVTKIQVPAPHDSPAAPFAVGIHFERGTAADLASRSHSRLDEFFDWLRLRINPDYQGREPTWSSVAQLP